MNNPGQEFPMESRKIGVEMQSEAKKPSFWVRRILPPLFAAAFSFALLEVGAYGWLRAFRGYDGRHLMKYQFDPYKNMQLTPNYRDTRGVYHNAQGFRRTEDTPRRKPPGTLRIFIMGGSTAYGLHSLSRYGEKEYSVVRNDQTIDHYLERYLQTEMPRKGVEVINAAITSFFSHHHLIYLNQTILKFDPDMVIFIDGFNDYYQHSKGFDQFRDYAYQERAYRFLREPSLSAWLHYTGWWLFRKSHAFHLGGQALRKLSLAIQAPNGRSRIDVDRALANLRENAENNFVRMVERNGLVLKHEGVIAVFTLQPEIAYDQSKILSPLEEKIYDEMANHWQENFIEFKNRARPVVTTYLEKATARTGATFIDLTDIFGGVDQDVFTDYCHLTPLGNQVLAEYLGARVLPLLRAQQR